MGSLKGRVLLLTVGVALLAVALTAWAVVSVTQDALVDSIDERQDAEVAITEELTFAALTFEDWRDAQDLVDELAADFDTRIVVTDLDGRELVSSGPGPLPPIAGLIDPASPLAQFGEVEGLEDLEFLFEECVNELGFEFDLDDLDLETLLFSPIGDAEAEVIEACFDDAVGLALSFATGEVPEPALLFIESRVERPIPWFRLGLIGMVVLALAIAGATAASAIVSRPIARLTRATQSIGTGELGTRVETDAPDEVRALAESFNEMAEELERADARRKQLTSDVAHELRTPVTNIIGRLEAVADGLLEATPEELEVVSAEALRLRALIDDLGELARIDDGVLQLEQVPVDLGALATSMVEAFSARAAEQGVELSCDCPRVEAVVDGGRIGQIVGNLLDNALTAAGEGGRVSIAAREDGASAVLEVRDDGAGIDEALLPTIFDRFRRGDASRTPGAAGRGLGLSIARALARAHGGDLTAANAPEGGAVFTLTLPGDGGTSAES